MRVVSEWVINWRHWPTSLNADCESATVGCWVDDDVHSLMCDDNDDDAGGDDGADDDVGLGEVGST